MRHLRAYGRSAAPHAGRLARVAVTLGIAACLAVAGCNKDKPPADDTKKSEPVPVPSGLVFNDFLPQNGPATGLGVRDSGLEGGLAEVAGSEGGEPGAADAPAEKLKVTEPGAEPRAQRKYTFTANRTDKRILTIVQSMTQSAGGQTTPPQEVSIKLHLDVTPKQVKPTGATVEAKVTKVELPGAPPQVAGMLAALNGLTASFEVSSRGEIGELQFVGTPQMRNQLAETVLQGISQASQLLLAPLPEVPVGVGAKWELASSGSLDQPEQGTMRFTLKEVSNEGGVIEADVDIKVPRRMQQGPRGEPLYVEADGKGKYTYQVRFDRMSTKVEGERSLTEKLELDDPRQGGKQSVTQAQKAKYTLETAPAGANTNANANANAK